MTRIHTKHIATMTEMREPHKVLAKSNGKPVAILKNSQVVGYFVPEEATDQIEHLTVEFGGLRQGGMAILGPKVVLGQSHEGLPVDPLLDVPT